MHDAISLDETRLYSVESDAKAQISRLTAEGMMKGWNKKQLEEAIRKKLPNETKHRAEAAQKRHNRTPEQVADIQRRWDERKAKRTIMAKAETVTDPKAVSYDDLSLRKFPTKGTQVENMMDFRDRNINSYLELQYHGNVTVDCVESPTFPYDLMDKANATHLQVAKKWKDIGAEIYYLKNGKLEQL